MVEAKKKRRGHRILPKERILGCLAAWALASGAHNLGPVDEAPLETELPLTLRRVEGQRVGVWLSVECKVLMLELHINVSESGVRGGLRSFATLRSLCAEIVRWSRRNQA